jgi:hypothetical protein
MTQQQVGKRLDDGRNAVRRELPRMPRRYGQWAATVIFLVATGLAAAYLWQGRGNEVEVISLRADVPAGHQIERADLAAVEVSGVAGAVPVADVDRVVGAIAAVPLLKGQVLLGAMVTTTPVPGSGERVVGVELKATRAPQGLAAGDVVTVLSVPPEGDASTPDDLAKPVVLAESATVLSVETVAAGGTRFSLLVTDSVANQVASFGAAGRIAMVQTSIEAEH